LPNKNLHKSAHVLVVDDERELAELLAINLSRAGYRTTVVHDGRSALARARELRPDLILLDVMLPELTGTEVAARIRTDPATSGIPIIMLTAKSEEIDQLVGLTVGADDYITKPFSVKVLLARVEAVLRRASRAGPEDAPLRLAGVQIDLATHEVTVDGEPARLTLTEFRLLAALAQANGRVLTRHHLMSKAMGPGVTVTERTIDVHMTAIRKKLGKYGSLIRTVRGVGYRATQEPEMTEV
jgi:two-component system phosphate regulon response regulator PhoB